MGKPDRKKRSRRSSAVSTRDTRRKGGEVWLNVLPDDLWVKVPRGDTVWEALQKNGVDAGGDCGGLGKCGKCKVKVISALGRPLKAEKDLLSREELREGFRLACRTKIRKDMLVHAGAREPDRDYVQILKTGETPLFHLDPPVVRRPVKLSTSPDAAALASLDRIKLALGPDCSDLGATIRCLRTLPEDLERTGFEGAAVLHGSSMLAWQDAASAERALGMVFDLGTSTLVGKLVSLLDGTEIAAISLVNGQMKFGTDVISRLRYVQEHADGLETLHGLLVRDMNRIARRLLEVGEAGPQDVFLAVAGGNTTIQHLLLSLSPSGIAEAPFAPVLTEGLVVKASDAGLALHPDALLYVMPTRSGYIGGDLIGVILASGAAETDSEIVLGMDFGTNGEIFLGNRRRILACSAAAGPALEGANISRGMIARTGAIESVRIVDDDLEYGIIGNIAPKGLCGSGLVDLAAVLLHLDVVDHEGRVRTPERGLPEGLGNRLATQKGVTRFLVAREGESFDGRPIALTQKDVRELQLAKGAIAAGTRILLEELGVSIEEVDRVCLAGALGNYIHPLSARRIGLLPPVDPNRIFPLGNAAGTGAAMVLLSRYYWQLANDLSDSIEHVELSSRLDFNRHFVENMDFPREDLW